MSIAITGGSGGIGRAVIKLALAQGHSIVSIDRVRPASEAAQANVTFVEADITNYADLAPTVNVNPDPVSVGTNLTYTVIITNNGPDAATNAQLNDTLPVSVTFVSVAQSQGSCSGGSVVTCNLNTIANGANASVVIVVKPTAVGSLSNSVNVTSDASDPNPSNNNPSVVVTVAPSSRVYLPLLLR